VARPEAVACLYSQATGVSVAEMLAEFGLERRTDYFARANRVRQAALAAARPGHELQAPAAPAARVQAVAGAPVA
jgi:hypothetical protein